MTITSMPRAEVDGVEDLLGIAPSGLSSSIPTGLPIGTWWSITTAQGVLLVHRHTRSPEIALVTGYSQRPFPSSLYRGPARQAVVSELLPPIVGEAWAFHEIRPGDPRDLAKALEPKTLPRRRVGKVLAATTIRGLG